jgi:tRNA U55 pseudouridine synthase TruB
LKISCGSGVYVRGIANDLGLALGVPALALDIIRIRVGNYKI